MVTSLERSTGGEKLAIDSLWFSYGGKLAIYEDVNLDVAAGEFLAVIGPSGCGKTTLLNLLAGFYTPERGSITLRGAPIKPEDSNLGYVFQQPTLFPWLSAIENVEFGLRMGGMPEKERRARAQYYFNLVGLKGFDDYLIVRLSGGMQQRVNLARALAMEPTLLLMDEPFGALDAITREIMNDELLRIWDKLGQSVVFITHDIDEAVYLSDRVCVLARPPGGLFRILKNKLPRPRKGPMTRTHDLFWQYKKELIADISTVTEQNPLSDEERELLKRSA